LAVFLIQGKPEPGSFPSGDAIVAALLRMTYLPRDPSHSFGMTKNNPKNNRINPEIPHVARDDKPFCHPEERFQATIAKHPRRGGI
jgi:hypothetical protein